MIQVFEGDGIERGAWPTGVRISCDSAMEVGVRTWVLTMPDERAKNFVHAVTHLYLHHLIRLEIAVVGVPITDRRLTIESIAREGSTVTLRWSP